MLVSKFFSSYLALAPTARLDLDSCFLLLLWRAAHAGDGAAPCLEKGAQKWPKIFENPCFLDPLVAAPSWKGSQCIIFRLLAIENRVWNFFGGLFNLKRQFLGTPKNLNFGLKIFSKISSWPLAPTARLDLDSCFFGCFFCDVFLTKNVKIAGPFFAAKNCVPNISVFFSGYKTVYKTLRNLPFEVDWPILTSTWPVFSLFGGPKMAENPGFGSLFWGGLFEGLFSPNIFFFKLFSWFLALAPKARLDLDSCFLLQFLRAAQAGDADATCLEKGSQKWPKIF